MPSPAPKSPKPFSVGLVYDDSLDGSEGVAQQVKLIGGWLSARGHKVCYFCGQTQIKEYRGGKVYSLATNVRVTFNGNKVSIPLPARRRAIKRALAETRPAVLHVQMPHSPFMAQKVVNAARGSAIVGTFHIYPANWLARSGTKLLKYLYLGGLAKFDEITSVSQAAHQFALDSFKIETAVIPNTVDLSGLKSDRQNLPSTIVFLGRLVERKGCAQLIKAFKLVINQMPDAKLIIGGKGAEEFKLKKLVNQLGLGDSVEFKGFIKEEDKADFLACASVACFPSLYGESFGLVLAEAMAAGAGAVVAGNNPGYASVMQPRPDLLCDPKDARALAEVITKLLNDDNYRHEVTRWQRSYVPKFDINQVGPQLEAVYNRAIAKRSKKRHN